MKRKAVFFDIDGTLWDFNSNIPESTVRGIHKLQENGHLAFINTGRSRSFVRKENLLSIGFDGIVSGCGTMIEYQDKVVFYRTIEPLLAEHTVRTVRKFGMRPILEGRYHLYMDDDEFGNDMYGKRLYEEMGEDVLSIRDNWGKWEISKLSCASDKGQMKECEAALSEHYDFLIHNPQVVEMVPKGFDKGVGIRETCELLQMDIADTVSFGDSVNDLAMLEAAGIGVVMGNGTDVAKAAADLVTTGLHEDGIWNGLKELGLI